MGVRNPWLPYTGHLPITTQGLTPDFGAQMIDFTSAYYTAAEAMETSPVLSYQPALMDGQEYYGDFSSDGNAFFYAGTMLQPFVGTANAATHLLRVCDEEGRAAVAYLRDVRVANSYGANIVVHSTMDAGYHPENPPFLPPYWTLFSTLFDPAAYRVGPPIFDLLNPAAGPGGNPSGPCAQLRVHQATGGFAIHTYDEPTIDGWLEWGARYVMDADFYRTGAMGGYGVYMCSQDDLPGDVYNTGWAIESAMPIAPSSWVNISRGYNLRIGAVKNHLLIRLWGLNAAPAAEQSLYFDNLRVRRLTMGAGLGTSMTGVMVAGSREGSGNYGHWLNVESGFTFHALRTLQVFDLRR